MFNCPKCGVSISIKKKLTLHPSKYMTCQKCSQEFKYFPLYFYSIFFVGPTTVSFSMAYFNLGLFSAVVLGFSLSCLLLVFQPIKKA